MHFVMLHFIQLPVFYISDNMCLTRCDEELMWARRPYSELCGNPSFCMDMDRQDCGYNCKYCAQCFSIARIYEFLQWLWILATRVLFRYQGEILCAFKKTCNQQKTPFTVMTVLLESWKCNGYLNCMDSNDEQGCVKYCQKYSSIVGPTYYTLFL